MATEIKAKYHAEIHVPVDGRDVRLNIFADTLAEIFHDLGAVTAQTDVDATSAARRELINAERKAGTLAAPDDRAVKPAQPPAAQSADSGWPDAAPVCEKCGTNDAMQLINFTDKKTGQPRQAWKCQACDTWHWPNGRGNGRGR